MPIIASLNAHTEGGWIEFAKLIQQTGVDAFKLNLYSVPGDPNVRERVTPYFHANDTRRQSAVNDSQKVGSNRCCSDRNLPQEQHDDINDSESGTGDPQMFG